MEDIKLLSGGKEKVEKYDTYNKVTCIVGDRYMVYDDYYLVTTLTKQSYRLHPDNYKALKDTMLSGEHRFMEIGDSIIAVNQIVSVERVKKTWANFPIDSIRKDVKNGSKKLE